MMISTEINIYNSARKLRFLSFGIGFVCWFVFFLETDPPQRNGALGHRCKGECYPGQDLIVRLFRSKRIAPAV